MFVYTLVVLMTIFQGVAQTTVSVSPSSVAIESLPDCPKPTANNNPLTPTSTDIKQMKATAYDDGESCPGGCKPHVVMDPRHNGSAFAHLHLPGGATQSQARYQPCVKNKPCRICFKPNKDCLPDDLQPIYMGSGPPLGVFDFSVEFYKTYCSRKDLPGPMNDKCAYIDKRVKEFEAERINCFQEPDLPECEAAMKKAKEDKEKDLPDYKVCKKNQSLFNSAQPLAKQRKYECAYSVERHSFGFGQSKDPSGKPCKKPRAWFRLLPGACSEGRYVGKEGLDCCSPDIYISAAVGGEECSNFFPKKPKAPALELNKASGARK